ncbi:MAG: glutamine synthetase family protein [Hyphomicrobium sp.]|uniref:glutamine synthetase family protein n=1 Tax=Hyphomicrobium sp. TaxID=82 RepID=UPI0039E3914D
MTEHSPITRPLDELENVVRDRGINYLRVETPDLHGIARSKTVPIKWLRPLAGNGLNFPLPPVALDVQCEAVQGTGYLEERGYPDVTLHPDFTTFAVLPYVPGTARVIADPYHAGSGEPVLAASRTVASRAFSKAASLGFDVLSGFEYEFYLLDAETFAPVTESVRQFASFDERDRLLLYEIADALSAFGIDVTTFNLEYGPSQFEVNFAPGWGLRAADQAYTFKTAVKEIAAKAGRIASFITKPAIDRSANGLHYNLSLWSNGRNAFADKSSADGLSVIARHFIAGQLHHAPALTALFAPTVNCAKRFRPHAFAPFEADWAFDNRTVALRVKGARGENVHVENRLGAGAANPYLVAASTLAAGLDGIRRKLSPPLTRDAGDETTRFATLPTSLESSLAALEADEILAASLGAEFVQVFTTVKRHEIAKARRAVSGFDEESFHDRVDPWELAEFANVL